jgi:hypothetical protein
VDFVSVTLVDRVGIKGGETRVFDADGPAGQRFTMVEPWTTLLLDDARVVHETTPIQPLAADAGGHRDTLVITLRAGAFQGPPEPLSAAQRAFSAVAKMYSGVALNSSRSRSMTAGVTDLALSDDE